MTTTPETPNDAAPDAPVVDTPVAASILGDAAASGATGADAEAAPAADAQGDGAAAATGDTAVADADAPPAAYEGLNAPEGTTLDAASIEAATPLLRSFGVPDERAQEFLDGAAPVIAGIVERSLTAAAAQQEVARAELTRTWADEARADPEMGGGRFDETVASAALARDTLFAPAFNTFLNETGLGNHPEMIRGLAKAGAQLAQSSIHRGEGGQQERTTAQKLYSEEFQPRG